MAYIGDLPYPEIKERILKSSSAKKRLLFALLFLTGARVGEVVRFFRDKQFTPPKKRINPPIKDTDIVVVTVPFQHKGKLHMIKRMRIKVKKEKIWKDTTKFKYIFINYRKEKELCNIVWAAKKEKERLGGGYLLDISTRHARRLFIEEFPEFDSNIHHFRHWRASCYLKGTVTGRRVPLEIVSKLLGHKSLQTTQIYDHVSVESYAGYL